MLAIPKKIKLIVLIVSIAIITMLIGGIAVSNQFKKIPSSFVQGVFSGRILDIEIANTPKEREQGLSGRPGLGEREGMLFVFEQSDTYQFWMKNMHFPLDIIWLNHKKEIIDISENISPSSYPETVSPTMPARYVLEVNAGLSRAWHLRRGDVLSIPSESLETIQ